MKNSLKRQYIKLMIMLSILMLLIFCGVIGVITYLKADGIKSEYTSELYDNLDFIQELRLADEYEENAYDNIEQKVYDALYQLERYSDVGFYCMLRDSYGNTVAEDQYFMIVTKYEDEDDRRFLLLGDRFPTDNEHSQLVFSELDKTMLIVPIAEKNGISSNNYSDIVIKGTCDDTYIYPSEVMWKVRNGEDYSYVPKASAIESGTMEFEDWIGDDTYLIYNNSVSFGYSDWDKCEKLNAEAKKLCGQIYDDFYNGIDTLDDQSKDGLFTCYVAGTGYLNDEYAIPYVYVFHPVSIAIDELGSVYMGIIFFGYWVIIILAVILWMTYKKQLSYEMNRQELTRGIAHELKTPLAITKGYIENWQYMSEEDKDKSSEVITDEIDHMNTMVMDLLELSRLEAKAKEMHKESVDILALAKSVLRRMDGLIADKPLKVTIVPDDGEHLVNADLEMMRTVLVNFISNAVKYAENTIDINITETGKKIKFTITNDGKIIERERLDKVWDEFYREGNSNNHHIGSSGLGLAITKNILILHKAKFGCKSKDGKTTFWFEMKKRTE